MKGLVQYIERHKEWSAKTLGPGMRTRGLTEHIRKELEEVEDSPYDVMEWVDVIILAIDGAWRAGYTPGQVVSALEKKQVINMEREWPEPGPQDEPSEHIR